MRKIYKIQSITPQICCVYSENKSDLCISYKPNPLDASVIKIFRTNKNNSFRFDNKIIKIKGWETHTTFLGIPNDYSKIQTTYHAQF